MNELEMLTLRKENAVLREENAELKGKLADVRALAHRLKDRMDRYMELNSEMRAAYEGKIRKLEVDKYGF